ncbi:MAG: proton-conducting transporter membrane subunit [Chloroflexota bacterium]
MNAANPLALIGYLPFLLLLLMAWLAHRAAPANGRILIKVGHWITVFCLALSVGLGTAVFLAGPLVSPVIGWGEFGLAIRLDALSVVMYVLVASVGVLVVQFSRNYLDGDPRQLVFLGRLYLTVGAVLMLVLAGNLVQMVLAWVGTSLALHQLLIFYSDRRGAIIAARKKFIVARLSDLCFAVAAFLFARAFGTGDLGALTAAGRAALEAGSLPAGLGLATVLVALAAALKSAMFPVHGWLLEVMETPTPVSALLHAGLLNAGTFLVVRLGDLMFLYAPALHVLIIVGGFTAIFASIAMISQTSVKVSLAYSSAAHMGFMLMLCGFGAHSVAIMHLVAHSYYKAHAFLSSGSILDYIREMGGQEIKEAPRPFAVLLSLLTAAGIFVGIGTLLGLDLTKRPGETALGVIFVMATTHLLSKGLSGPLRGLVILRTGLAAVAVTLAFFALELSAAWILGDTVAVFPPPQPATLAVMVFMVVAFGLVILLQAMLPVMAKSPSWRAAYVHLKNGLYANAIFDRLIGALR